MPSRPRTAFQLDPEQMRAHADAASRMLRTLGNDNRLMILCLLAQGERSVGQLNERLDLSQSALSQHLAVLRHEGLVDTRRDAQTIYYALAAGPAERIIQTLHDIYCGSQIAC
ncbi:MAG: winged helix-turn-helix transcriptional regulator [Dokdonella sp.]|uniref:ArsR/SmtB family transcription factor n=1 Tax=Dokdonella sp. TaxID=2291710 RepID=UPI0025C2B2BA|nr:metalloregulator ArsR/SmtB family transcription factor [Dokdonella sp.]MBX3700093.1 winged helix-turn-helix transcriptional regulator [Dokdonella sp.]MCW5578580.1 winged helix-turn-helix transcriptional regulator [Dokdonella sp.]